MFFFDNNYINLISSLIIFTHLIYVSLKFNDVIKVSENNIIINFVSTYSLLIIIISYLSYFLSLFYISRLLIISLYVSFIFYTVILNKRKLPEIFSNHVFSFKKKYLIIFSLLIILFFLLSLIPPSDADSLDYHLGAPIEILKNNRFLPRYDWLHYQLIGIGDFFNLFSLSLYSLNLPQLNNFFVLILLSLIFLNYCNTNNFNNVKFFILFIFSTPLILWLITSSKPQFFQTFLIFFSIYLVANNQINKKTIFVIIAFLAYAVVSKISFLIVAFYVYLLLFYISFKRKFFLSFVISSITILILLVLPFYLVNFIYYGDPLPPMFESFKSSPSEVKLMMQESIKTDTATFFARESYSFWATPFLISIPVSLANFTVYVGPTYFFGFMISIYILFISAKLRKVNFFDLVLIGLIISEYLFLVTLPNLQPRYFLAGYFVSFLLVAKYLSNYYLRSLYIILNSTIMIMVIGAAILSIYLYFPANFSKERLDKYYSFTAQNYDEIKWIEKKIGNDNLQIDNNIVLSQSTRSHALINYNFVSRQSFFSKLDSKSMFDFLEENNIDYLVFEYPLSQNYYQEILERCASKTFGIQRNKFKHAKRNPINSKNRRQYEILLIKNECKS